MSTCSHGVPRIFHCTCDKPHPHPPEHVCDDPIPRLSDFGPIERGIILALLAGRANAEKRKAEGAQ